MSVLFEKVENGEFLDQSTEGEVVIETKAAKGWEEQMKKTIPHKTLHLTVICYFPAEQLRSLEVVNQVIFMNSIS